MEDSQKRKRVDNKDTDKSSLLDEKHQNLLNDLSALIEKMGGGSGTVLMEELQCRLELVVQNFHDEVKTMIKTSFENWKIKDSQLRDLISSNLTVPTKSTKKTEKLESTKTPEFIKNVNFGPLRTK